MKNVRLNYGTLIVDCEKAEILMYIGKTSMHEYRLFSKRWSDF